MLDCLYFSNYIYIFTQRYIFHCFLGRFEGRNRNIHMREKHLNMPGLGIGILTGIVGVGTGIHVRTCLDQGLNPHPRIVH